MPQLGYDRGEGGDLGYAPAGSLRGRCLERLAWMCALASVDPSKGETGRVLIHAEIHWGTKCLAVLKPN